MENTHVYAVELIEESFDSSAWFCVVFSVYYAHECLFLVCIWFVYAMHVISCFNWSLRGRQNEFQLFLYLSQEISARCAVEFIRIECVDEGSVVELLFSFAQKWNGLLKPCKECAGWRRSLDCVSEQKDLRTAAAGSAQSLRDSTLEKLLNAERKECA